jgi:hypothetical protein
MQHRAVLPTTIVIGILTALTLVYTAATVAQPPFDAPHDNDGEAVVRSFYAAVNDAIRLGDSAALGQVTAPDVKISSVSATIDDRDELASHIMDLRAAYPALAIEVIDVIADRDRAAARITISGAEGLGPLVTPTHRSGDNEPTELFRVEDGMIAEYHGLIANLSPPRQLLHETMTTSSLTETDVGVARLTLAPEARLGGLVTLGPTIYAVITGELEIQVDNRSVVRRATAPSESPSGEQIAPGAITELGMGDQIEIGASVDYSLQTAGREGAVAVATTWMPPDIFGPPTSNNASVTPIPLLSVLMYYADTPEERAALWPSGVDNQPLLPIVTVSAPSSMISLSLWQTTLVPGATMTVRSPDGATRLMVDSGRVIIESHTQHSADEMTVVTAGKSARLNPRDVTTVRNIDEAPIVLSLLVVTPSSDPPTLPLVTPIHLPREVSTKPKGDEPSRTDF